MHSTEMHKDEKRSDKEINKNKMTMESNMYIDNCTIFHSYSLLLGNYQQTTACRYSSEDSTYYEGILKYKYFGILYFKNVLSFPSLLKPSGLTVLDMMVPDDMVQISTPAPCTGYTVKSLFCISSKEKLTEFYVMVTVYPGLYQKPLVAQKITILNHEKNTHILFKPVYEPIL